MSAGKHGRKGSSWRKRAWESVAKRDGLICRECGAPHRVVCRKQGVCSQSEFGSGPFTMVNFTSNLELDHLQPLSEGGSNDFDNLWLLCQDCHKRKTSSERSARLKKIFSDWREAQAA